jgi:hypothetical protein
MKHLNKAQKDTVEINKISEEDWLKHYKSLWYNPKEVLNNSRRERYVCINPIIFEEMNELIKIFENREALNSDELNMGLFKYASTTAKSRFLNVYWTTYQIPEDWKKAIIIRIFKTVKGQAGITTGE